MVRNGFRWVTYRGVIIPRIPGFLNGDATFTRKGHPTSGMVLVSGAKLGQGLGWAELGGG